MDDVTIARALHVLAVVHWIGGVAMVTAVVLPAGRLETFLAVEARFSRHVKWSVALAGLTGFYMTERLEAWPRFLEPGFWWMHAMVLVWTVFALLLFVAEPLFLHRRLERLAESRDEAAALRLAQRGHVVLLAISAVTIAAAVLGAHGMLA